MANKKYLLDTHCLIWFQQNNVLLTKRVFDIIEDRSNIILFTQVSMFELAIKLRIGKLTKFLLSVEDFYRQAVDDGFTYLPLQNEHIFTYQQIPLLDNHRDPFDRLLIATAIGEKQ